MSESVLPHPSTAQERQGSINIANGIINDPSMTSMDVDEVMESMSDTDESDNNDEDTMAVDSVSNSEVAPSDDKNVPTPAVVQHTIEISESESESSMSSTNNVPPAVTQSTVQIQNVLSETEESEGEEDDERIPSEQEQPIVPAAKRPKLKFDEFEVTEDEKNKENMTKARRLKFLLDKSAFFAHCLSSGDAVVAANKRGRKSRQQKAEAAAGASSSNRHRKTEKEEDEELLKAAASGAATMDGSGVHSAAVTFLQTPPFIKNGEMRDYQIRGLNWLINLFENGINGILADEMGLGKTLQTISLLGYLKHYKNVRGHYLVVLPKSTLVNWENEFRKWCPSMRAVSLIGDAETRKNIVQNKLYHLNNWDVLLTTYEMILREKAVLKKIKWTYLIIDEAHRIKNENSKLSEYVREFHSSHRLLLTGTPLQNNLHELWALLNFLLPDVFDSSENFDDWFNTESCLGDNSLVTRLHSVLRPFLLRRIKSDVEKDLPPKKEIKVYVPMVNMQRTWYKKILMKDLDVINGAGKLEKVRLMNILMHLRKCCNHPYLFDGAEQGPPYTTDMHLVSNSGKLMVLDKLLPKLQSEGSRVLIFSQMTRLLDILEDYCLWRQFVYHRLDGNTAHEDRQRMIDEYNSDGSPTFLFMLSTRAGGLGINLASADVVIIYDSDWNPQMDLQAMDRAHRIGQKKQVRVFRLITENTVDEKIIERAAVKLKLDKLVIQQGRLTDANAQLKKEDMLNWIRYGANLVFSDGGAESISDETIESILERSKSKADELNGKLEALEESNLRNFALESQDHNLYNFEGENYREKGKGGGPSVPPLEWIEPPKRERKAAVYSEQMFYKDNAPKDDDWRPKNPKPPRHPTLPDYQFFPKRLHDLLQMEVYYYQQSIKYKVPRDKWDDSKESLKLQKAEQKKIDTAKPLGDSELEEKEALFRQGFTTWYRKDFNLFLKLVEKHGRDNMTAVAEEFEGKEEEEVLEYAQVFIRRFSELKNADKILLQIGKSEEKRMRKTLVERVLCERIAKCRKPLLELRIPYNKQTKMLNYTVENDRFLISTWYKLGFESTDEETYLHIRQEILKSTDFRFDWFFKSRSVEELRRRCHMVWALMEKDIVTEQEIANFQLKMKQAWALFAKQANSINGGQEDENGESQASSKSADSPPPSKGKRSRSRKSKSKNRKSAVPVDVMEEEDSQHSLSQNSQKSSSSRKSQRSSASHSSSTASRKRNK